MRGVDDDPASLVERAWTWRFTEGLTWALPPATGMGFGPGAGWLAGGPAPPAAPLNAVMPVITYCRVLVWLWYTQDEAEDLRAVSIEPKRGVFAA